MTNFHKIRNVAWKIAKQGAQIVYEKIPTPIPFLLIDVLRGKWLISQTPIPKGSLGFYGRILATIPQTVLWSTILLRGGEVMTNAQKTITDLFSWNLPEDIDNATIVSTSSLIAWSLIYWLMAKWWDLKKILKQEKGNDDSEVAPNNDDQVILVNQAPPAKKDIWKFERTENWWAMGNRISRETFLNMIGNKIYNWLSLPSDLYTMYDRVYDTYALNYGKPVSCEEGQQKKKDTPTIDDLYHIEIEVSLQYMFWISLLSDLFWRDLGEVLEQGESGKI